MEIFLKLSALASLCLAMIVFGACSGGGSSGGNATVTVNGTSYTMNALNNGVTVSDTQTVTAVTTNTVTDAITTVAPTSTASVTTVTPTVTVPAGSTSTITVQ